MACVLVGTALLAATGVIAFTNYETAVEWRARFAAAEADVAALVGEVADRDAELGRVTAALQASERDVQDLESRVGEFASEKAQIEDEREEITAFAERLTEISIAYDDVASQFDICVAEQSTFTQMIVDFDLYWYANRLHVVEDQAIRTGQVCGSAQGMLRELRRYIDGLAG